MERGPGRIFRSRRANPGRLSLTPCFSWVKTVAKEVGTVSTVSTDCCKPLKRFWSRCHLLTQLKQGVNERTSKLRSIVDEICGPWRETVRAPLPADSFFRSIFNLQLVEG